MRYTEISREGQHFPLESFQSQRPIKHLIGAGGLEAQGLAKISDQLLPRDWKMKGKVVPIKSKSKAKASTKMMQRQKRNWLLKSLKVLANPTPSHPPLLAPAQSCLHCK